MSVEPEPEYDDDESFLDDEVIEELEEMYGGQRSIGEIGDEQAENMWD